MSSMLAPVAMSFDTDSTTARYAPLYGLASDILGLKPHDISEQVLLNDFSVDIRFTIA